MEKKDSSYKHTKEERELIKHFLSKELVEPQDSVRASWNFIETVAKEQHHKNRKKKLLLFVSIAASLVGVIILANIFWSGNQTTDLRKDYLAMVEQMVGDSTQITLHHAQKEEIILSESSVLAYDDLGNWITGDKPDNMEVDGASSLEVKYDKLIVPKGKRMTLLLSDSTKLWVNSGSKVIYPTIFRGSTREIFVEGEVYLEVKKNAEKPFIVATENFDIKVLGTSFNISAYKGSTLMPSVVLVEGKVNVKHTSGEDINLHPNQMLEVGATHLGKVMAVNATDYTSWTKDYLVLRAEPLPALLNKLSVIHGMTYNVDDAAKSLKISGKLDIRQEHNEIMKTLETIAPIEITYDEEHKINIRLRDE